MLAGLLMSLALAGAEGSGTQRASVCTVEEAAPGAVLALEGNVRMEGASPMVVSGADAPPPNGDGPGRIVMTSPDCPGVEVTLHMSRSFNGSMVAFAFYMMIDLPSYRSGESVMKATVSGRWETEGTRLVDADLVDME